jgi:hypothetical protein
MPQNKNMKAMARTHSSRTPPRRRPHDITTMTNEIASHIPRMWMRSSSEDDFWRWFCGEAQSVMRNAADPRERTRLHARLLAALSRAGLPQPPPAFRIKC